MRSTFVLLLLLLGISGTLTAQTIQVSGVISNASGEPLAGVTVNEKGSARSVQTQANGQYSINVAGNAVLVVSHVGYEGKEVAVNDREQIDISLLADDKSLEQVVVVGYGTQKRKDLTGAISSVSGAELAKVPVQNVAQALQGRLAGVQVTMTDGSPGAEPSIKIRGGTSITQSNQPLYVVDGVPQTDGLAFLDPMDIENIDVLKDASATAIYGARGANGVVLITTKQTKAGKVTVNYDGYVGIKKITSEIPVMGAYDYLLLDYERRAGDSARVAGFETLYGPYDSLQTIYGNRPGKNWQDEVFGSAVMNQYHKISINGGSKETRFNVFYSRNKDEGIMLNSGSTKNIGKIMLNHKIGNKLTINAIANYSNQKITGLPPTEGGNARLTVLQTLLQYRPVSGRNPSDDDALLDLETDPLDNQSSPAFQSPIIGARSRLRERVINTLNANATLQYNINRHLTYRGLISYTVKGNKFKQFNTAESIVAIRSGGPFGSIDEQNDSRLNYNNTLTYNQNFGQQHRMDVTVGQEYIYNYLERFGASASNFPTVNNGWDDLSMGTVFGTPSSYAEDDKLLSFFGRVNYGYKDKYLLTASLRADGSSKFGANNRWGIFPSAAFAWRIINEEFIRNIPVFSDLKLRVSYGQSGNNRISNYAALGIYTTGSYPLNNNIVASAYQNNLPNPNLKWEANQAVNIGLDLGLWDQRVTLTAELYDNRSKDLLFDTRIPSSSGFITQFQNIGTTSSRGLEFTLNTANIRNANFNWNTSFNIAFNRTKVLELSEGETSKIVNSYTTLNDFILQVGQPVGIMYGYVTDGLYQVSDFDYNASGNTYTLKPGVVKDNRTVQPGYQKFKDISGPDGVPDGVINDLDRTAIGNANPRYTGGINNTFSYKGFDLSVFLNFSVGNDVYNANVLNNAALSNDLKNTLSRFTDRWMTIDASGQRVTDPDALTALNQGKTIPSYIGMVSDRLYSTIIEDGSFLRINNVSLGYSLPKSWIQRAKIANARVYFTAYNLHVFTKYSGYDPEVSTVNNAITPGVDFSAYPRAKSFVFGINLSL
ncbi:SusC/RagA family TonB-linked outer membrane protein [Niabella beijingensis]|uniref:SusC/RagA family TonB-linked outer membrane protein n=1 Tax=Niabella beijingensis TaxID=2872700 RepID=UPI001CBC9ECF|nr:TonB-dependent receptor [Niabella beijingensis]MBZ4189890.1 TonB-dependent receptor [Niabella beijingensis]